MRLLPYLSLLASALPIIHAQQCPSFPSPLPAPSALSASSTLPDPFTYFTSTLRVSSVDEWYNCRRPQIKQLLQSYQYGFYPDPKQEVVTATRSGNTVTVNVESGGKRGSFTATLSLPSGAGAGNKVPVMFAIGGVSNAVYNNARIAVATVNYGAVAPDSNAKTGAFWSLYNGRDIGVLTAWAWGVHRTLDALALVAPEIDTTKTSVTGCSRLGKAALAAGLFDERITVTVPMSSGIQGLGPYRYWQLSGQGENLENSKQGAPWWTSNGISPFLNQHERLPYDAHVIAAAIAPQYVLMEDGQSDPFVNARGTATIIFPAAKLVYRWLGIEDRIGMALRTGGHCDQTSHANVVPFLQKVFFNTSTTRDYNNLSPWSATTSAFPWGMNLPQQTGGPVVPPSSSVPPIVVPSSTTTPGTTPTPPPANCAGKYSQCGGQGWTGPTCCVAGTTCSKLNDWYSQCN